MSTLPGPRWWIAPPGPDESLRSVLSRAAALYECNPEDLWEHLNQNDSRPSGPVDSPSAAALERIASAIGMPKSDLMGHELYDAPWLLAPTAREVYCPRCWFKAQHEGRPCSILRSWARVLRTMCPAHGYPLRLAPFQWAADPRRITAEFTAFEANDRAILDLIDRFGHALDQSLFFGAPWPPEWHGDPESAQQVLMAVSMNVNDAEGFPLIKYVQPLGDLGRFVRGPRHVERSAEELDWGRFRGISDPAVRRAALWAAAWTLTRDPRPELSPGWFVLPPHILLRLH